MDTHGRSSRAPIDPADYVVGPDTPINEIDLEQEEFILRDGRRLTDELAAELARELEPKSHGATWFPAGSR